MATNKATAKKPAAAAFKNKTTVRTLASATRSSSAGSTAGSKNLPKNIVNIVLAELVGTFILTIVMLITTQSFAGVMPLYVGLTFALLVFGIGAVSSAHINPALTFGLWAMRKLKSIMLPFYWAAQFLGAMLAVIVVNWMGGSMLKLDFGHMWDLNWSLFSVEMIGMAVFMFGFAAVSSRTDLSIHGKAFGSGLSLVVGLLVAGSLLATVQGGIDTAGITKPNQVPHAFLVKSATLNPAVALASTENTGAALFSGARPAKGDSQYSRFGLEVVLGTLVGAAVGGNLYLLLGTKLSRR